MATDYEAEFEIARSGKLVPKEARKPSLVGPFYNIQFVGVDKLKPFQCERFQSKIVDFYKKIREKYFHNVRYFMAQVKLYEEKKVGKQKHSIHLRLATPSKTFSSDYAGFDLDKPLSEAIRALDKELLRFREKTRERWTDFGIGRKKAQRNEDIKTAREEKFAGIKERGSKVRLNEKRKIIKR